MLKKFIAAARLRGARTALSEIFPFYGAYFPYRPEAVSYLLPRVPASPEYHASSPLPIPPAELRLYGTSLEEWLALGEEHVRIMRALLQEHGAAINSAGRILDLGCREGRMIRWLSDLTERCEIWGIDVSAREIVWCRQYLSPPFHFATTTLLPHLPFEDRYFGLIYAGSVFTHIDDLADAWFQEVRRVLWPGGMLYITIHDERSVELLERWQHPTLHYLKRYPEYEAYAHTDFGMFTIGRRDRAQVFYNVEYLQRLLAPFFTTCAVVTEAYTYQTGLLLRRT